MGEMNASESSSDARFAEALRAAIDARGVTLAWLGGHLRDSGNAVSGATLSYWRSGARRPEGAQSMAAVAEIERVLGLDEGALSSLIGRSLRVGPFGTPAFPLTDEQMEAAVTEVFTALGEEQPDRARDVTTQAVTEVGADGAVVSRTTRTLLQSMSGLITHVPYVELSPGTRIPSPRFEALGGGRIVAEHAHASQEVHGFLIELDRPIDTAETTMLEWRVSYAPGSPPTYDTGHGVARQCRELLLWTRFHPDAIPTRITEIEETPEGVRRTPIELTSGTSVHQVQRRFGPGMLILEWSFD